MTYTKLIERLRSGYQGIQLGAVGMGWDFDAKTIIESAEAIEALQAENERLTQERDAWKGNCQELSHLCQNTIFERDQLRIKVEGESVEVKLWCETCEGQGVVDNTLGGDNPNSTDHDPCPDCDGSGGFMSTVYRTNAAPKALAPEQVEAAWRAGWAACRDVEYVGQEAEDEAWGMSETCANADWESAAPKALAPLTDERITEIARYWSNSSFARSATRFCTDFARAIESAHGIGGTP